jgi:hypothetical protein
MQNLMRKSEFAKLTNVHRSRVSHWISDSHISGDALVGTGRKALIDVDIALRRLKERLDVDGLVRTGLNTNLSGKAPPVKRAAPTARGDVLTEIATVQEAAIHFGCWVVRNKPSVPAREKLEILREAVEDITRWMDTGDIFERDEVG